MKIIFFGTPKFAIPSLEKILNSGHNLLAVVTSTDKEKGRGLKTSFSDVKDFALKNKIEILQPNNLKDESFINELKKINADLFIVVAFKILPFEIYSMPKFGSFNLHASLLPKYRGAAPIQWALINGETKTGVTSFKLEQKVDTGNIYLQKEMLIDNEDDYGKLYDRLSILGSDLILETISIIESGSYKLINQDNSFATPAPKIIKDMCKIDWNKSAKEIHNLVRGLAPFPTAFFIFKNKNYKIFKTEINYQIKLKPEEIFQTKNELIIGCSENSINILEIQKEGKKRMLIEDFLRGFSFKDN